MKNNKLQKKVHIATYGCQMNERDSESIAALLIDKGYEIAKREADADILLFNTCSVREHAEHKAIGKVGILKKLKREKPDLMIGILGCMAQNYGDKLFEKLPHVDFVLGPDQFYRLPEVINIQINKRVHLTDTTLPDDKAVDIMKRHIQSGQVSAFISIMRGCNCFCSYCIVPFVRGRERSRCSSEIILEAQNLAKSGIKEICLLGQNIAAYGLDGKKPKANESSIADLLEKLSEIEDILRIRFTSPHPGYFNDRLIDAIANLAKVCKNVHLPMQSGSDQILKLMNRNYTSSEYLDIVNKLKSKSPGITFSTDVIVGFPGETEEDFNATRNLMNEAAFDNSFIFKYSPRSKTAAEKLEDNVPQAVKEERNQILLADLAERTEKHNKALVGETFEILVEGVSKRNPDRWFGRTGTNKLVVFDPSPEIKAGDLLSLKIHRATAMTLFGEKHKWK